MTELSPQTKRLMMEVHSEDYIDCRHAVDALRQMPDAEADAALLALLNDERLTWQVGWVMWAAYQRGVLDAADYLARCRVILAIPRSDNDSQLFTQRYLIGMMRKFLDNPEAIALTFDVVRNHPDRTLVREAMGLLHFLENDEVLYLLKVMLTQPRDPALQVEVVRTLSYLESPQALTILLDFLDKDVAKPTEAHWEALDTLDVVYFRHHPGADSSRAIQVCIDWLQRGGDRAFGAWSFLKRIGTPEALAAAERWEQGHGSEF